MSCHSHIYNWSATSYDLYTTVLMALTVTVTGLQHYPTPVV